MDLFGLKKVSSAIEDAQKKAEKARAERAEARLSPGQREMNSKMNNMRIDEENARKKLKR